MKQYNIKSKNRLINILEGVDINDNTCKGIILNIHGLGSHFQYVYNSHDELVNRDKFFSQFDYKTFGFEFHGHGKSEGSKCTIYDFNDLLDDLYFVLKFISSSYPYTRIFLIGESMGCAVIIKYIADRLHEIAGIILLSPMCGISEEMKPSPFMVNLILFSSNILPWLPYGVNKPINDTSASNEEYNIAYRNCPYTFNGLFPLCTLRELYKTSLVIPELASKIDVPIIIFQGKEDTVTNPDCTIQFHENIHINNDKEIVLIEGKGHNLLVPKTKLDKYPESIYRQIVMWLTKHAD
jgi:acylglycerol lipase